MTHLKEMLATWPSIASNFSQLMFNLHFSNLNTEKSRIGTLNFSKSNTLLIAERQTKQNVYSYKQ